jgi:hydrogenase expression/formation protein HypE
MRDPTRGGLAAALNEVAATGGVGIEVYEDKVPVDENVVAVCEILGLDPYFVANEGKVVAVAPAAEAEALVAAMRGHPLGAAAAVIGEVVAEPKRVYVRTVVGGTRVLQMPFADQLPRIC